jgi:hypothetical protein
MSHAIAHATLFQLPSVSSVEAHNLTGAPGHGRPTPVRIGVRVFNLYVSGSGLCVFDSWFMFSGFRVSVFGFRDPDFGIRLAVLGS